MPRYTKCLYVFCSLKLFLDKDRCVRGHSILEFCQTCSHSSDVQAPPRNAAGFRVNSPTGVEGEGVNKGVPNKKN